MSTHTVLMTRRALADMEDMYLYIANELQVPEIARQQYDRIADAIEALANYPFRHRLLDSQPERQLGMRLLPIDNYAAIYIATETEVTILRVLYGKSDIITRLRNNR